MTADGRKGLELSWNLLNLADSAAMHGSSLTYAWLSDGTKVSAKADDGSGHGVVKRYLGSFVFTTSGGSSTDVPTDMESVAWDEGRIFFDIPEAVPEEYIEDPDPEINPDEPEQIEVWFPYRDCWFAGDHLGNVRSVIDITPDLSAPQILEQSDYLPFGTKISNPNLISGMNNRWRYAGKEEQRFGLAGAFSPIGNAPFGGTGFLDLALLDFGARMYDPFTARWTAADPLATCDFRNSPFVFCINNPGSVIDPFGTNWYQYQETGCYFWFDGDEEREGYENLGENLSVQGSDGLYRNFYHNQFLGVSKALISDITSTVINDKSLLGICLSNKSSLSEDDKEALFEKIVSTAGDRFLTHPETLHSVTLLMTVASAADFLGSSYGAFLDCLTRGHVFWSGGIEHAGKMAADYAYSTGMRTLEMTWAGKLLSNLTSLLGYDKTKWLWRIASKQFAKETYGTAHVFLNNPTKESIWLNIEKTTLEKNGVFIITHNL